jgi:predicted RNA methylase
MVKKIINITKNIFLDKKMLLQTKEIEWAHVYNESIRGKYFLQNLPLNVGRWAGNYSFFYILNRILNDYEPSAILDLGLGESSKFISTFIENKLTNTRHVIIEQDQEWINSFKNKFTLSSNSEIKHCKLIEKNINGYNVFAYENFIDSIILDFDFFIVDGPFGSERYSRYDIVELVEKFDKSKEFIILVDDSERVGEIDTINTIINKLKDKEIIYHIGQYIGNKQNTIIASEKYKYSTTL